MKKIVLLCILFSFKIFAQVDSLFSKRLSEPYQKNFIREIISGFPEDISSKELLKIKKFCLENELYGSYVFKTIVMNDKKLVAWLETIDMKQSYFIRLNNIIDSTIFYKHDNLDKYLINYIKNHKKNAHIIYAIFGKICNYDYSKNLSKIFDFENDYESRGGFIKTQIRFKSISTDSIVKLEFEKGRSLQDIYLMIKYPIKKYNRYDFLPQLRELPKRVEQIRTPDNRYADKILKELETLIPYLEQKKKENAPIGLPLDWGVVKE